MTSSSASMVSMSFAPADVSTPSLNHQNGANASLQSDLSFATAESSSSAKVVFDVSVAMQSNSRKNAYSFGMIETDDSTDDEEDVEVKPGKRPAPPAWSLPVNRNKTIVLQTGISIKVVDELFGEPPDVDLLEIFPNISKRFLKRRESSFVWQTPPRYSVLPKY